MRSVVNPHESHLQSQVKVAVLAPIRVENVVKRSTMDRKPVQIDTEVLIEKPPISPGLGGDSPSKLVWLSIFSAC